MSGYDIKRPNRRVRRPCKFWKRFDERYEMWKRFNQEIVAAEREARQIPVIIEPPEPYILSLPIEVLPLIFEHIEKPMWLQLTSVSRSFRWAVTECLRSLSALDVSEFLKSGFGIHNEGAVEFLLSHAKKTKCLKIPGECLRVLREPVVERICALKNITELDINRCFVTRDHFCAILAHLPRLEQLSMRRVTLMNKEIDFINRRYSPMVKHLTKEIAGEKDFEPPEGFNEKSLQQLTSMKNLKALDISECAISDIMLMRLMSGLPHLEEVMIDGNNVGAVWSQSIVSAGLESLTNLKSFRLCNNKRVKIEWILGMRLENLRKLWLVNIDVLNVAAVGIILQKCTSLEELNFTLKPRFSRSGEDLAFHSLRLVVENIPNAHLLKSLSLFNVFIDCDLRSFFLRCVQLEVLDIDPYQYGEVLFHNHVLFMRLDGVNILRVPLKLYEKLTTPPVPRWVEQVVLRVVEETMLPDNGFRPFSISSSAWSSKKYQSIVENTISSLSMLKKLRVLGIVTKARRRLLSQTIPDEVLQRLDTFGVLYPVNFPEELMETDVRGLSLRFCRSA